MTVPTVNNERGVVLLAVLIVVTLLTIIVIEFTYSVSLDQHRARNAVHALQATLLARSGVNIAESFLATDEEPRYDAYTEPWWIALQQFKEELVLGEGMLVKIDIRDETAKININATRVPRTVNSPGSSNNPVITADAYLRDALRQLFQNHGIKVGIVDDLKEYWLQDPVNFDQAAVPDFKSLEEFARTFEISTEQLRLMRRFLVALPLRGSALRSGKMNINTVSAEILAALLPENPDAVEAILDRQGQDPPFTTLADLTQILQQHQVNGAAQIVQLFGVNSALYRLRASALTNVDPEGEVPGGIGQTLTVLVRRSARPNPVGGLRWTFEPLDWQKEGGARLFRESVEASEKFKVENESDAFGSETD